MEYYNLIKEICKEENILFNIIFKNWVMILNKNGITKYIYGYKFPLNNQSIGFLLDDKYAVYELCKTLNIPILEHRIVFSKRSRFGFNRNKELVNYFNEFNKNVVIKPNNGTEGMGISHINNINDLKKEGRNLLSHNYSICVSPFYDIKKEYRVVVLDNKVELSFEKIKPIVKGNGINTIRELLNNINPSFFKDKLNDKKYDRVLVNGEIFEYDWCFNLSRGAIASFIKDNSIKENVENFALSVTKKIGIRFASVDIVLVKNTLMLMEINGGICISKACNFIDKDYQITKNIYKKAILKMFE